MKRALNTIALLGLVPTLTSTALGATNTITTKKAAIVQIHSPVDGFTCTGTVVGVRPLTVLTAFHCIDNAEDGGVLVAIEAEKQKLRTSDIKKYLSTKAVVNTAVTTTSEYQSLSAIAKTLDESIKKLFESAEALQTDANNEALKKEYAANEKVVSSLYQVYQHTLDGLKNKVAMKQLPGSADIAVLVFDRYDGPLNKKDDAELIKDGELIPLSPNTRLDGATVAFGGFGRTALTSPAVEAVGAFTNRVQKQAEGLVATFGFPQGVPVPEGFKPGKMGAVLPGDSGGPLMTDYGIVGVASFIKVPPMESPTELAPGWPRDMDGFYPYQTGRFVDLSSESSQEVIALAKYSQKLNIQMNQSENLGLTDIDSWNKTIEKVPTVPSQPLILVAQKLPLVLSTP